jgi:hypothetical protein
MNAGERCRMQLQDQARPQPKRPFLVLDKRSNHFDREIELLDAVLGFPQRDLMRIFEK